MLDFTSYLDIIILASAYDSFARTSELVKERNKNVLKINKISSVTHYVLQMSHVNPFNSC